LLYYIKIQNLKQYESSKMIPEWYLLKSGFWEAFITFFIKKYYILLLFFITFCFYLFLLKEKYILIFLISTFIGYLLFINIFFDAKWDHFYTENLYLPLGLYLIGIHLPYLLKSEKIKNKTFIYLLCFASIILFFVNLNQKYDYFHTRVEKIKKLVNDKEYNDFEKIIVNTDSVLKGDLGWSFAVESFMLSKLENKNKIFISNKNYNKLKALKNIDKNTIIIYPWKTISNDTLNKKYFNLPPVMYKEF
jgi:hypothetical protein